MDFALLGEYRRRFFSFLTQGMPARFYKNISWQYVSSISTMVLGFLYSILIGRALGKYDFGLIALGLSFATVIFQVFELRLHEAVIRYITEFWENDDKARTIATVKLSLMLDILSCSLALIVIASFASLTQTHLIRDPRGVPVILLSGLAVFCANVASYTSLGLIRVFEQFKVQAVIYLCGAALKLILSLVAIIIFNWNVLGVIGISILSNLLTNASLVSYSLWQLYRRTQMRWSMAPVRLLKERLPEMGRFTLNSYLLTLSMIPTKDLDITLLGWFTSLDIVGLYKISKNFLVAMWSLADPAFLVVYPELAKMWSRKDLSGIKFFVKRLSLLLFVVGGGIFASAFIAVPFLIRVMMGSEFVAAGIFFRFMSWGILVWAPLLWVTPLFLAVGRPDITLKGSIIGSIITIVLYCLFIPLYGGYGAGLVYSLTTPIVMGVIVWIGKRAGYLFPESVEQSVVHPA